MDAPAIRSNTPGSFAWGVIHRRHPALIAQVRQAHPYPPRVLSALDRLADNAAAGKIEPLDPEAPDGSAWRQWAQPLLGLSWYDAPFLGAESYFYRKLLEATGFFEPGPWQGVDPFEPQKAAELTSNAFVEDLSAVAGTAELSDRDKDDAILQAALWGNRADLGFRLSTNSTDPASGTSAVIVDHSAGLWDYLDNHACRTICLVADNAGRELLADLVLIDHLLATARTTAVELHLKAVPYYVSDTTTPDLIACLRTLTTTTNPGTRAIGQRLRQAINTGRIDIHAPAFYTAPLSYHHMPPTLADRFAAADLTIFKGDLNYRRLVGDNTWPATTEFDQLTGYFPGPVAALRTLKSDVIAGLDPAAVAHYDATEPAWRTSGTHAVIQMRR